MNKKLFFAVLFFPLVALSLSAQNLGINPDDLRIELRPDGGFHLFIRKKPDIGSVLLTETTKDPNRRASNYAYRAGEWNPVNGDEVRMLDGAPIPKEKKLYSLISSTVENHPALGRAFHIYIPHVIYYGYEWERHGEVNVGNGTYLNIRAFTLPHADYRGAFQDNPFVIQVTQERRAAPPPPPEEQPQEPEKREEKYSPETVNAFTEIAKSGELIFVPEPEELLDQVMGLLGKEKGKSLDVVVCLDTTGSMKGYIVPVRQKLVPMLRELVSDYDSFRIGMVLFKDYRDEYLTRLIPFTTDFAQLQRSLNAIVVRGGGDIPEAVYEALYAGATGFRWEAESKLMILIGDAPPHPKPRGSITKDMVDAAVAEKGLTVHAIVLPDGGSD